MNERTKASIENLQASKEFKLDMSSIVILDDMSSIWIAFAFVNNIRTLLFVRHLTVIVVTDQAEQALQDWILQQ